MAVREKQPLQGGFATIVALALVAAAPVLAAPDRNICDDAAAPSLRVSKTEFSSATPPDADTTAELLGPAFEFASRERDVGEDEQPEPAERAVEDDTESEPGDTTISGDAGPLVYKRPMYRRDI